MGLGDGEGFMKTARRLQVQADAAQLGPAIRANKPGSGAGRQILEHGTGQKTGCVGAARRGGGSWIGAGSMRRTRESAETNTKPNQIAN